MFNYSFRPYHTSNRSNSINMLFSLYTGNKEEGCFCFSSYIPPRYHHYTLSCWEIYATNNFPFPFPLFSIGIFKCSNSVSKSSCRIFTLDWNSWKSQICGLIPWLIEAVSEMYYSTRSSGWRVYTYLIPCFSSELRNLLIRSLRTVFAYSWWSGHIFLDSLC